MRRKPNETVRSKSTLGWLKTRLKCSKPNIAATRRSLELGASRVFYGQVFSFYGLEFFFWCASYYRPRLFSVGVPLRGRFALRLWWLTARFPRLAARGTRAFRFMHSTSKDGSVVAMRSRGRLQTSACDRDAARRRGHMYRSRRSAQWSHASHALAVRTAVCVVLVRHQCAVD